MHLLPPHFLGIFGLTRPKYHLKVKKHRLFPKTYIPKIFECLFMLTSGRFSPSFLFFFFFDSCNKHTTVGFSLSPSVFPLQSDQGNHSKAAMCWRSHIRLWRSPSVWGEMPMFCFFSQSFMASYYCFPHSTTIWID